jgi:predicted amidohydrolase YtcJ
VEWNRSRLGNNRFRRGEPLRAWLSEHRIILANDVPVQAIMPKDQGRIAISLSEVDSGLLNAGERIQNRFTINDQNRLVSDDCLFFYGACEHTWRNV